ncbi:MAG: hypothetical protein QXW47_00125 [Candidatus Jordarchaeales archaeon]|nr:hypothetical protein [Candidatus Jordarchaeia archaeon]
MEVEVYLPRRVAIYEERSREYVLKKSMQVISELFDKLDEYARKRDAFGLLKMVSSDIEKRSFYLLASEWAKDRKSVLERIGFILNLPGLVEREERYSIYVMLSYSKGFTVASGKAHHPGDLERVIIFSYPATENRRTYYCFNTAAHGYPSIFPVKLGEKTSLSDALKEYCFHFKPGDHALILVRKDKILRFKEIREKLVKILGKLGLKKFLTFILNVIRETSSYLGFTLEREIQKFYLIDYDEIKGKLKVDLDGFLNSVIYLDRKISELKKETSDDEVKRALGKLSKIIWQAPISAISHETDGLLNKYGNILGSDVTEEIKKMQLYLDSAIKRVHDLKRESLLEPESYLEKHGIKMLSDLSFMAKATIPLGLEALLNKPLYDWGYPEKAPLKDKIGRILFAASDVPYRYFQEAIMDLESKVL